MKVTRFEARVISASLNRLLVVRLDAPAEIATLLIFSKTKSDTHHSMQEGTFFGLWVRHVRT